MDISIKKMKNDYDALGFEVESCSQALGKEGVSGLFTIGYLSIIANASIGILEELRKPK